MTTLPDYEAFARAYVAGEAEVAVTTLVADLETPVSAYLKLARGRTGNMFLLESVEGGAQRGRYSMIGLDPDLIFRSTGEARRDQPPGARRSRRFRPLPRRSARRAEIAACRIAHCHAARPAADVGGRVRLSRLRHGAAHGALIPSQARPDRRARRAAHPPDRHGGVRRRARRDGDRDAGPPGARRLGPRRLRERHGAAGRGGRRARSAARPRGGRPVDPLVKAGEALSNTTEAEYKAMVVRAKDYIAAGDAFQIVLSQRFTSRFDLPAFALYRALRRVNPSPYLCFLDFGAFQIVCSSPEILVRVRDGKVVIRPIAGTRPAGQRPDRGRGAGGGTPGRSEGARRTSHAARPRPQRRRPRGEDRHGQGDRLFLHRAL